VGSTTGVVPGSTVMRTPKGEGNTDYGFGRRLQRSNNTENREPQGKGEKTNQDGRGLAERSTAGTSPSRG